jgi:hypothetical protein
MSPGGPGGGSMFATSYGEASFLERSTGSGSKETGPQVRTGYFRKFRRTKDGILSPSLPGVQLGTNCRPTYE